MAILEQAFGLPEWAIRTAIERTRVPAEPTEPAPAERTPMPTQRADTSVPQRQ